MPDLVDDDSIAALAPDPGGVDVRFQRGRPRRSDQLVSTDELHSRTRRLAFGPEVLPSWSRGRVVLLGDSAASVSLLGDGSSMESAGA